MKLFVPEIDTQFFCICNRHEPILTALVSSYIYKRGYYAPTFEYSTATAAEFDFESEDFDEEKIDEHHLTRVRSRAFNIKVENSIKRLGGCEYLILIGLTKDQLSYLSLIDGRNAIYIDSISDVDVLLKDISNKETYLECKTEDIYNGLFQARFNEKMLKINEAAPKIILKDKINSGIVVVEKAEKASAVIAVNYAASINASLRLIDPPTFDERQIRNLVYRWKQGESNAFNDLSASIYPNIEHINFQEYRFATFFTEGIPYGLILKNIIPISHVHLLKNIDFFIFNNLYYNLYSEPFSAVVFSPLEFENEETKFVINKLVENKLFVKPLVGESATVFNLDNHVKEYPFSLLHICSHGGEIEGSRITENFFDGSGNEHEVEYDEVFSYGISPYEELIPVTTKFIWRKFDGLEWGSKELKEKKYAHHVFSDMLNELKKNKDQDRNLKVIVEGSCHIKCYDSVYQAMFDHLAAGHSPIIFNNTCWSWSDIADSFIGVGARGYIGTLWAVNNDRAKLAAEIFYEDLFEGTVLESFHKSQKTTIGTNDENIYIFWGLHFCSMVQGASISISRKVVLRKMQKSLAIWQDKLSKTKNPEMQERVKRFIEWNVREQVADFKEEITQIMRNDPNWKPFKKN